MKFKVYPWLTIDKQPLIPSKSWGFYFIPNIQLDHWIYKGGGFWLTLQFSWLIFGITFDWSDERESTEVKEKGEEKDKQKYVDDFQRRRW